MISIIRVFTVLYLVSQLIYYKYGHTFASSFVYVSFAVHLTKGHRVIHIN